MENGGGGNALDQYITYTTALSVTSKEHNIV